MVVTVPGRDNGDVVDIVVRHGVETLLNQMHPIIHVGIYGVRSFIGHLRGQVFHWGIYGVRSFIGASTSIYGVRSFIVHWGEYPPVHNERPDPKP